MSTVIPAVYDPSILRLPSILGLYSTLRLPRNDNTLVFLRKKYMYYSCIVRQAVLVIAVVVLEVIVAVVVVVVVVE